MPDKYLGREEDPALQVARASGPYLFNARGRRYIDFVSGWCVGNLGWNHPVPTRAVHQFRGPDYIYPEHGPAAKAPNRGPLAVISTCVQEGRVFVMR